MWVFRVLCAVLILHCGVSQAETSLVIFGATGDLTARKLIPALYHLAEGGESFSVVGVARSPYTNQAFRDLIKGSVTVNNPDFWKKFAEKIVYHQGEFDSPESYAGLHRSWAEHKAIASII